MKYKFLLLFPFLLFISLTASKCKKDKTPINAVDQLPPETQTGANTFGCLVDGKVFLPKGIGLNPRLTCYYQYIYYPSPSGFVFQVSASDNSKPSSPINVNIGIDSISIENGKIYQLQTQGIKGIGRGNFRKFTNNSLDDFYTYSPTSGELLIKKFDEINQIASGTFWFNAVNVNGDTVHVTDGRFDMQFTK